MLPLIFIISLKRSKMSAWVLNEKFCNKQYVTLVWEAFQLFSFDPVFRTSANDLWAAFVCYTCIHSIYSGNLICLFCWLHGLLRLVCTLSSGGGHWRWPVSRPHTLSGERFTLLEMWPRKYIVKVYFFRNVYGIPPLLTGLDSLELYLKVWTPFILLCSPTGRWYVWTSLALCDCSPQLSVIRLIAKC